MKPFDLVPTAADFSRALTDFDDLVAAQPTEKRNCWFYTALLEPQSRLPKMSEIWG